VLFKLNLRRLLAFKSLENISRGIWIENLSILVEKACMAAWGYHLLFVMPSDQYNYFFDTVLCWTTPSIPSGALNLYYLLNMASALEEVLWWCTSGASTPRYFSSMTPADYRNGKDRDAFDNKLISLYHVMMAGLLMGSYYTEHLKIGSILLFIHHSSDACHYLWRMSLLVVPALPTLQAVLLALDIIAWIYCRIWLMLALVMYSVAVESKSFLHESECYPGECNWRESIERLPGLAALINLLFINAIWLLVLVFKWYEAIPCKQSQAAPAPSSPTSSGVSSSTSYGSLDCGVSSCMSMGNPISCLLRHR
jgi:hypothetical protein